MTTKEFLENYNHSPYSFDEIVELLTNISDNKSLSSLAKTYLDIKEDIEMMLDDIGFEFG